jgi:hypothetical protein
MKKVFLAIFTLISLSGCVGTLTVRNEGKPAPLLDKWGQMIGVTTEQPDSVKYYRVRDCDMKLNPAVIDCEALDGTKLHFEIFSEALYETGFKDGVKYENDACGCGR